MTKPTFRRFFAYIFDSLIVVLIATAFSSIKFINPHMEEYENVYNEYNEYVMEISQNPENANQIIKSEKMSALTYDMANYGKSVSIVTLVVSFLYFVVFQFVTNGKTAGKLIMGIEVIPNEGDKLKFTQVLLRSALINSLLTSLLLILAIIFVSRGAFFKVYMGIEIIDMAIVFVCCGMIIAKDNGVGLHDMLAHTMVIKSSEKEEILKNRVVKKEDK